jgi:flagellar protein FliO/FliZ
MLAALGIVLGGLFVVYHFTRRLARTEAGGGKDKLIRILANKFIGVKKNICMVEVAGSILVLGVTNDRITLLSEIADEALVDKIRQAEGSGSTLSFSDHLNRIVARIKTGKDD